MERALLKEILADQMSYPIMGKYIERDVAIQWIPKKATILTGVRRSGKSTLAETVVFRNPASEPKLHVHFADERLAAFSQNDFRDLLDAFYEMNNAKDLSKQTWFIFDEIQMISGWELFIERLIRDTNNRVTVTGSSARLLSKEIATEMRGRALSFEVFPLSFSEFLNLDGKTAQMTNAKAKITFSKALGSYLLQGGFPELIHAPRELHKKILQEYFESIVYRDIVERHEITNVIATRALIHAIANQQAKFISINKLFERMKSVGFKLQKQFVSEILGHLEDAYSFFFVSLFTDSVQKQQVNPKKVYCIDTGLVTAIRAGIAQDSGRLLEGAVYIHLRRRGTRVFYYKTTKGLEVDFVFEEENSKLCFIQVCWDISAPETMKRETEALVQALKEHPRSRALILYNISSSTTFNELPKGIQAVPAWEYLCRSYSY